MPMQYWECVPPVKWQAGTTGNEETAFYFDCAGCGAKGPTIAGFISDAGTFKGIGLMNVGGSPFMKTAMFCAECFAKRVQK